ncbi:hypothetical protein QH494_15875 [Sphingomonas sp. AR_OL41]|nr:hypothetical protein [Sphingomonas sp. AR_OL41]
MTAIPEIAGRLLPVLGSSSSNDSDTKMSYVVNYHFFGIAKIGKKSCEHAVVRRMGRELDKMH